MRHLGDDYNCRCWATPASEELSTSYPDAINSTIGPFDLLAGGLVVKGGLRLTLAAFQIFRKILTRSPSLDTTQEMNLARFIKKIPANSKNTVQITKLKNGDIKFMADSPGKSPGSRAVYEKTVNPQGKTVNYTKTTYDKQNNIIHTKTKFIKGNDQ